jgi:LysM repeat protein
MASNIGIKIANGEFYPILEEGTNVKKRLILTTVHDSQRSVQIDLYKSEAASMADATYIGSLVIENITPKPKGDPSIEMIIASTESEEIIAEAVDLDSPGGKERQQLSVSLQALEETGTYEVPDFELESDTPPPEGLYDKSADFESPGTKEKKSPLLPILLIIAILLLVGLLIWYFFARGTGSSTGTVTPAPQTAVSAAASTAQGGGVQETAPAPQVAPAPQAAPAPDTAKGEAPTAIEAPQKSAAVSPPVSTGETGSTPPATAQPAVSSKAAVGVTNSRARPPAPVTTYKVPRTIGPEGVRYKIRWGDTLWDIAEAFYRNPWLFSHIARFNKIKNPDLIISGTSIRIPPPQK